MIKKQLQALKYAYLDIQGLAQSIELDYDLAEAAQAATQTLSDLEKEFCKELARQAAPQRSRMRCATCKSEEIRADAVTYWDYCKQEWSISHYIDGGVFCERCMAACDILQTKDPSNKSKGKINDRTNRNKHTSHRN